MVVAFDVGPVGPTPAGVGVYALSLASALAAADVAQTSIRLIGRREDADARLQASGSLRRSAGPYLAWVQRQAMKDAALVGAELVHFSDGVAPIFRNRPVVLAVHDLSVATMPRMHPVRRWPRLPLVVLSPRLAVRVVVPSRATADEVMRVCGVRSSRIVISPYAPQQDLEPTSRQTADTVARRHGLEVDGYILALGTVEPRKNHVRLISAFNQAIQEGSIPRDLKLVIAGRMGWAFEKVTDAIAASPVRDQIVVLGFVEDAEVSALLTGARMATYVSSYEGFGLPVVEAMACGVPTVTSAVSSMPEVAGAAGFLVDPADVSSITDGLARAFEAGQDRDKIAKVSQAQAAQFSWSRAASELMDVYGQLLGTS